MSERNDLKRKMVEEYIPLLQCYDCKDVPGPSKEKRNRYNCVNESHVLCEKCKDRCPCGSEVGKKPLPIVAKNLEQLPWMCCYFENGCRQSTFQEEELESHKRNCEYRKVYCPIESCSGEIVFCKLLPDHFASKHESNVNSDKVQRVSDKKFKVQMSIKDAMFPFLLETPNENFLLNITFEKEDVRSKVTDTITLIWPFKRVVRMYLWVSYIGSPDEAKNFTYTIEIGNGQSRVLYQLPVLSMDHGQFKHLIEKNIPMMNLERAVVDELIKPSSFCNIDVTIHSLKEEAKDENVESGVSDVSD